MSSRPGRTVLITGCSTGFGPLAAVAAARRGWHVVATMRDPGRRQGLDDAIAAEQPAAVRARERAGGEIVVRQLDVTDERSITTAVAEVLADTGRIDAVVHNAGIAHAGFFEDIPDADLRAVFETNFFGVLALTRAVLPAMRARRSGRIVVMSSSSAFMPEPALTPYTASKFAVEGWAQSLAVELAPFGIDVALLEPGTYKTNIWDSARVTRAPGSAYQAFADAMEPMIRERVARDGRDPVEVGERVAEILDARRPSMRNPVGPDSHIMRALSHLAPFSLRARLLARATGLNRPAPRLP